MNVQDISTEIQKKIIEIDAIRKEIKQRGLEKATAIMTYEREMAIKIVQLKNGVSFDLGGEKIKDPPASVMEKIAKGLCFQERLNMECAEVAYKSVIVNLDAVMAQLNAYQSLNRYLDKL